MSSSFSLISIVMPAAAVQHSKRPIQQHAAIVGLYYGEVYTVLNNKHKVKNNLTITFFVSFIHYAQTHANHRENLLSM